MRIRWQSVLIVLLVTVMAVTLGLQRQANRELQGEIELHRGQENELARLRAEWTRLTQGQLQVDELKNLRTDHVAVMRLRGEVDAMRARVQEAEKSAAK
ncbi:MAG: hypothetical protein JWM32_2198 [Verrucomicrobia bacterium]|nr:hypothetical protein [Verrucomicrobiota bacterium]